MDTLGCGGVCRGRFGCGGFAGGGGGGAEGEGVGVGGGEEVDLAEDFGRIAGVFDVEAVDACGEAGGEGFTAQWTPWVVGECVVAGSVVAGFPAGRVRM